MLAAVLAEMKFETVLQTSLTIQMYSFLPAPTKSNVDWSAPPPPPTPSHPPNFPAHSKNYIALQVTFCQEHSLSTQKVTHYNNF